ncbi:hypothetical protein DBR24_07680, partial [Pseudomonas sp. HMWF006]
MLFSYSRPLRIRDAQRLFFVWRHWIVERAPSCRTTQSLAGHSRRAVDCRPVAARSRRLFDHRRIGAPG